MHLERSVTIVFAALTAFAAANPSFTGAAQQVVDAVQQTGRNIVNYGADLVPEWASTAAPESTDSSLMKRRGYHKKKKHQKSRKHRSKPTAKKLTSEVVRKRLAKANITENIIDDFIPSFILNVTFPTKHTPFLGQVMKPEAASEAPLVSLYPPHIKHPKSNAIDDSLPLNNLVVIMTDPDAPSRADPKWGEVCHWIAVGLPVRVSSDNGVAVDENIVLKEIMPYKPPGPPPKTHKHRYVLLAFTPANATSVPLNLVKPSDRRHWGYGVEGAGVKRWANEMGLLPIAGDYFRAKYHPTVSDDL